MADIEHNYNCDICGIRKTEGNHFKCSKKRQKLYRQKGAEDERRKKAKKV